MQPLLTMVPSLDHSCELIPPLFHPVFPVLPVLRTLPLVNATVDFSLSTSFFISKASVAVTTSLGGCENYTV